MAVLAGMALFALPAAFIVWLYQPADPMADIGLAAAVGGILLGLVALVVKVDTPVPMGMIIYYFTRTILNIQRAWYSSSSPAASYR